MNQIQAATLGTFAGVCFRVLINVHKGSIDDSGAAFNREFMSVTVHGLMIPSLQQRAAHSECKILNGITGIHCRLQNAFNAVIITTITLNDGDMIQDLVALAVRIPFLLPSTISHYSVPANIVCRILSEGRFT